LREQGVLVNWQSKTLASFKGVGMARSLKDESLLNAPKTLSKQSSVEVDQTDPGVDTLPSSICQAL
jgi:hypothetical protein